MARRVNAFGIPEPDNSGRNTFLTFFLLINLSSCCYGMYKFFTPEVIITHNKRLKYTENIIFDKRRNTYDTVRIYTNNKSNN